MGYKNHKKTTEEEKKRKARINLAPRGEDRKVKERKTEENIPESILGDDKTVP